MKLNEKVMLITRMIQPIVWQPYPAQPTGGEAGIGDMNPTFFLSPANAGKLIYGLGPAFILPTATSPQTGQGKFSLGPSVVALAQPGNWTVGVLINNVFSVAGSSHRPDVNQMLLQYFVNYNLKKGYYLTTGPIVTANWNSTGSIDAATGNDVPGGTWTVPFGGALAKSGGWVFSQSTGRCSFTGTQSIHPAAHRGVLNFKLRCSTQRCPRRASRSASQL